MKTKILLSIFILTLVFQSACRCQNYEVLTDPTGLTGISDTSGIANTVTIKVIYDNFSADNTMQSDWGFSTVILGLERGILFDTGTKPSIFVSNFRNSGIDASKIDILFLSHEHGDHTGGIPAFAKMRTGIPAIFPHSFSEGFKKDMVKLGYQPLLSDSPALICRHLYTSGEFRYTIAEQALVLDTRKGLVVITGCAHPGIIDMLRQIRTSFNKNIYMVLGGFHLIEKSEKETEAIISEMKSSGIVKCGATHCTGEKQIKMFREAFGENYVEMGAGNTITLN